jgi:hypothetical protein
MADRIINLLIHFTQPAIRSIQLLDRFALTKENAIEGMRQAGNLIIALNIQKYAIEGVIESQVVRLAH